jgi:membrane-bound metal-dependent hydrolase YbcI (DUF457 family)
MRSKRTGLSQFISSFTNGGATRWIGLAPVCIFLADLILRDTGLPRLLQAVLDESGHILTDTLFLGAGLSVLGHGDLRLWFGPTLIGAVLIDADHVPLEFFGWASFTEGATRPYSHSLSVILTLSVASALLHRPWDGRVQAVAFGLATHLVRDMATGGVPLVWPLSRVTVEIPYPLYAALLVGATLLWVRRRGASFTLR